MVEVIFNKFGQTGVNTAKIMNYTTYKSFLSSFGLQNLINKEALDLIFYENSNN